MVEWGGERRWEVWRGGDAEDDLDVCPPNCFKDQIILSKTLFL